MEIQEPLVKTASTYHNSKAEMLQMALHKRHWCKNWLAIRNVTVVSVMVTDATKQTLLYRSVEICLHVRFRTAKAMLFWEMLDNIKQHQTNQMQKTEVQQKRIQRLTTQNTKVLQKPTNDSSTAEC